MAKLLIFLIFFATILSSDRAVAITGSFSDLRVAIGNSKITFDPLGMPNQNTLLVSRQINCQLTRLVAGQIKGELADRFQFDEKENQIVLHLRDGAMFSDKSIVKVEDVENSLKYYLKNRPFLRNTLESIVSISSDVSARKVIIKYRSNPKQLLDGLSMPLYPIYKSDEFVKQKRLFWQTPTGCGTYRVIEHSEGRITLQHKDNPHKRVIFTTFVDNEITPDKAEGFDIISLSLTGSSVLPGYSKRRIYDPYQIFVGINTKRKSWLKIEDRQSALAGFDLNAIVKAYGAGAEAANDFYPKGTFGYDPSFKVQTLFKRSQSSKGHAPFCIALVRVSVPKSVEAAFAQNSFTGAMTVKTIFDAARFKESFLKTDCDFMAIGLKSNSLDGYEFQLLLREPRTNFTQFESKPLVEKILQSQKMSEVQGKFGAYRQIANDILGLYVIRPLVTIPYKQIYVRDGVNLPEISDVSLNEVLLDW